MTNMYKYLSLFCGSLGIVAAVLGILMAPGMARAALPRPYCENNCVPTGKPPNCTCPVGPNNDQTCDPVNGARCIRKCPPGIAQDPNTGQQFCACECVKF